MKMKWLILIGTVLVLIATAGCSEESLNHDQAMEKLTALAGEIDSNVVEHQPDSNWLNEGTSVNELPPIDKYPLSVQGNGQLNIELFSSTEKSGTSSDNWMEVQAKKFNEQNIQINGKTVSVSIRPIASGLALDYITKGTYVPDAYTPANQLWGEMISSAGVPSVLITDRLTGNTAGILMSKPAHEKYTAKYGEVTIDGVVKAVMAGDMQLGHTDPNVSSTGLNIYTQELRAFDANNPFSSGALEQFRQFQSMIPPASPTTAEMSKVAAKGIMDTMIMESQAYSREPSLSDWVFTPAGVRHDSPVYALNNLSVDKTEALKRFVEFCKTPEAQNTGEGSASSFGFNQYDEYKGATNEYTGTELFSSLQVWKVNKDGGRPVISVFVVDRSGSMEGAKINRVKEALKNSLQYINDGNYIGLVSYSSENDIKIDLPIDKFTPKQGSLFAGAVNDFKADGGTATNSALVVALDMATKAQAQVPGSKIRILVLSDGDQNRGLPLHDVIGLVNGIGLPVYGIGFEANLTDLKKLADINEGYCINADSEDVIYKLRNLFTAEL
ncbi:MAG: VWA domain-containing protein [bacterium]|nr:VWA domain-containing protein [bacterium]